MFTGFNIRSFAIKCSSWEYWPMWVLYLPVFIQHFWLAFRAKSLFFFLRTNPAIDEGFILSDSKFRTLKLVPAEYIPAMFRIPVNASFDRVREDLKKNNISYPLILKPDIGFRGLLVHKIDDETQLKNSLNRMKVDHIIQEFVDHPVEIGVFYYRMPDQNRGAIPSLTLKEFLSVTGDGVHTFSELIDMNPRAVLQKDKLRKKFSTQWNSILPDQEKIVLECIGNHNRGTKFINANGLLDDSLLNVFDELNRKMPGFYFGRFDIRARSIEDLKEGRHFKILEVNGVGAEPTHIYDPDYRLITAWGDMLRLWRVMYSISVTNKRTGVQFPAYSEARNRWEFYKNYKRIAFAP